MPITNSARAKTNPANPLSNIRIHRSQTQTTVPMLNEKVAPAGVYISKIVDVTASKIETTNADAVDLIYELTADDGRVVQGRIRYEIGGYHFDRLGEALIAAGLPDGSPITDAVGTIEEIEIVYPRKGSLAKIKSRHPFVSTDVPKQKPVAKPKAPAVEVDEDDEFDDFNDFNEEDDY